MPNTQVEELPPLPEPAGFRMRYRSEPGMLGHYPWTYADQRRRRPERPEHQSEDLFTADQLRAYARAALEAHARALAPQWQPIETAPKDKWFLAHGPDRTGAKYMVMCREGGLGQCFISADDGHGPYMNPTHWMPLPPAPKG